MRTSYFSFRFASIFWFLAAFLLSGIPAAAMAADAVTPQVIQGYIAHADPAKALQALAPILKADPHSAKAWYLEAEALDALGHDPQAKTALGKAEHLSPSMPFANPSDLHELEHRVGLANVQASHEMSKILHALLWFLVLALLTGIVVYAYFRSVHRKIESLAESERQDVLLAITQYLTDDLNVARISADAHGDTARLASIEDWQKSLVDCAQGLKQAVNADLETKRAVTEQGRDLLAEVRAQVTGQPAVAPIGGGGESYSDGPKSLGSIPGTAVAERGIVSPDPVSSQPLIYSGGNASNVFGSALENGLGMGLGIELAEDLMGDNRTSFDGDPFSSGSSSGDGFGGIDNGLSSSGSSGGADDGLAFGGGFGGADDGLSSGDSSW